MRSDGGQRSAASLLMQRPLPREHKQKRRGGVSATALNAPLLRSTRA